MAWQDDPVITNVRTTGHPIDNLDFPAITICGLGMIEATLNRAFSHQVDEFLKRRNMSADWVFSNDSRLEAENLLIESGLYDDFIGELYPGNNNNKRTY